eukprot:393421-Pleurochrysis_carterae.AAC.4
MIHVMIRPFIRLHHDAPVELISALYLGGARPTTNAELKLTDAATPVAPQVSVMCKNGSLLITARPVNPRAHVTRKAKSPLDQDVAMRFGVSTQHTNKPRKAINLGIYSFNLTYASRLDLQDTVREHRRRRRPRVARPKGVAAPRALVRRGGRV